MTDVQYEGQLVEEDRIGERFQEFHRNFFDLCQRPRRFVLIGGVRFLTKSDFYFVEVANKLKLLRTVAEAVDTAECVSLVAAGVRCTEEDVTGISEVDQQPDIVRSAEGSELLPVSPDIVPEMDEIFLHKQWSEPGCSGKASPYQNLRRTVSYEKPASRSPQIAVKRQMSDSVAYASGRNENRSFNRYEEEQMQFLTPSSTQGVVTCDDDDDESTSLLQLPSLSSSSMYLPAAEVSANSNAGNIPPMVAGWQLSDENDFESVHMPSADESFVTAADVLDQDRLTLSENWQAVQQPVAYRELHAIITELENRLIQQLLIALLRENYSPEFVHSVAEALCPSASEAAATGRLRSVPFE